MRSLKNIINWFKDLFAEKCNNCKSKDLDYTFLDSDIYFTGGNVYYKHCKECGHTSIVDNLRP